MDQSSCTKFNFRRRVKGQKGWLSNFFELSPEKFKIGVLCFEISFKNKTVKNFSAVPVAFWMLILVLVQNSLSSWSGNSCRTCASLEGGQEAKILHCTSSILNSVKRSLRRLREMVTKYRLTCFALWTPLAYCKWCSYCGCPVLLSTFPCFTSKFSAFVHNWLWKGFFWSFSSVESIVNFGEDWVETSWNTHPSCLRGYNEIKLPKERESSIVSLRAFLNKLLLQKPFTQQRVLHFVDRNVWSSVCKQCGSTGIFLEQHSKNLRF